MNQHARNFSKGKPKGKKPEAATPDEGPINLEAERIVLASILADNRIYEEYGDSIGSDDFSDGLHRQIFEAAARMIARGKRAEPASIMSALTESAPFADMTTAGYVDKLKYNARKASEISAFIDAVKGTAIARRIRAMCARFDGLAKTGQDGLIDSMSTELTQIAGNNSAETYGPASARVASVMDEIRARRARGGGISGISTGFPDLDRLIDGLGPKRLYVLGARPKQGKTAIGLCIMRNMMKAGHPICFFSLEMPKDEIIKRMICLEADVDFERLARGEYNEDEELRIEDAAQTVEGWPFMVDEAGGLSPDALALRARHAVNVDGAKAVFIDYLQCLKGEGRGRYEQITDVSQALANLRKVLGVPVFALAQLNRKLVDRSTIGDLSRFKAESLRPNDGDLRDSGQIEQDGDVVMFIHRPEVILEDLKPQPDDIDGMADWQPLASKWRGKAELIVHFNRAGKRGIVNLHFDGPSMKFTSADNRR